MPLLLNDSAYIRFSNWQSSLLDTWYKQSSFYSMYSWSLHLEHLGLAWSPILILPFWHFVTSSDESGWNQMASRSVSPLSYYWANHFQLKLSSHMQGWLLCAFWNKTLIQLFNIFYGSRHYIFLKINFNASYAFWGYFIFVLLAIRRYFEPKGSFTLKMDSDVHDSFISPNHAGISRLLLH